MQTSAETPPSTASLSRSIPHPPRIILFDWHATLVDTMDAMYQATNDMLGMLEQLGLLQRLVPPEQSKTVADRKLVDYVRRHRRLHPRIVAEKKVSRTDLLEVLFGRDEEAKELAHRAFSRCYGQHYGEVSPFEPGVREVLSQIRRLGIRIGILSNRAREFLEHELEFVEAGSWFRLFDAVVAGDDTPRLKPAPDPVYQALEDMKAQAGPDVWYVGDSTTDVIAARGAGVTSIFFNGAGWKRSWIRNIFPGTDDFPDQPDYVVDNFDELLALVRHSLERDTAAARHHFIPYIRTLEPLARPDVVLFDWHATLADTLDAMYKAVDEVLPRLRELGLASRLLRPEDSKNDNDARLVRYVRDHYRLHPKIKAARKISRTDIFEVLFGDDEQAKQVAHEAFNECYRRHYGHVTPFEPGVRGMLATLRDRGIRLGVLSNRDREFLDREIAAIDEDGWTGLFDTVVAGDDAARRKPAPDPILKALENLGVPANNHAWYVGDSTTDTISAKRAGVTSVFYNGAQWSNAWLSRIFPGTPRHPHRPDAVVDDFDEFLKLVSMSIQPA
ncbi:MAG TPA: HAD-IA family hydrolase [Arenicellales bacterium]|nr:HAD-IA family hydrolase [Arenicellales bacterium]